MSFLIILQYAWLYDAEKKHSENMSNALALPSIEQQAAEYKKPVNIDTWTYKNLNSVMYVPEGIAESEFIVLLLLANLFF